MQEKELIYTENKEEDGSRTAATVSN